LAGTKHAVVIGVKEYETVPALRFADKDARNLAETLPLVGFEKVLLFEDGGERKPTRASIFHHLGLMKSSLDPDDLLLFYFSGHGMMEDNVDYLLPIEGSTAALDVVPKHVGSSGPPWRLIAARQLSPRRDPDEASP
jgi:uncharacterized caspase-like protein